MSLFTVIRYPISDPPTRAQLEALPRDLFDQWIRVTPTTSIFFGPTPRWIAADIPNLYKHDTTLYNAVMYPLRQLIIEYDSI